MATKNSSRGGLGTVSVLTIIFVVLKLTHNISWSWAWVLSPLWLPLVLLLCMLSIALLAVLIGVNIKRLLK